MCFHPQRWSASTTVRWRRNTRCYQQFGCRGSLFITPMAHFSVTCMMCVRRNISCSSCDSWDILLQRCAYKAMQVAEWSDSCWKCSSGWHAICLRQSYNSRTTFQLTQSVARLSRRQPSLLFLKLNPRFLFQRRHMQIPAILCRRRGLCAYATLNSEATHLGDLRHYSTLVS